MALNFPAAIVKCPYVKIFQNEKINENIPLLFMVAEKAVATHSSNLAWKIPCMEEPGRLQSMGSRRVGHD